MSLKSVSRLGEPQTIVPGENRETWFYGFSDNHIIYVYVDSASGRVLDAYPN